MKRLFLTVLLAVTVAGLLSCSGGGGGGSSSGGTSRVTMAVGTFSQSALHKVESSPLFAKAAGFFRFLLPDEAVAGSAVIPSNVKSIVFTITGAGMTTITKEVSTVGKTEIVETFDIPNGSGRAFTVEAKNSCGSILYSGTETADINGAVSLDITLADSISKFYYDIESLISASSGTYTTGAAFGTDSSTQVSRNGIITLTGGEGASSITIDVPCEFRNGAVMELQVNYLDGGSARFTIKDDHDNVLGNSEINGVFDIHQTYTWQIAVPATETLTITTNSTVILNAYAGFVPLNRVNNSGTYIADIGLTSSRVKASINAHQAMWDNESRSAEEDDVITFPSNFITCEDEASMSVDIDISDIVSSMTQPVLEFNFGRAVDQDTTLELYGDSDNLIVSYLSDDVWDEEMGQTFIVDISDYKNSSFFRIKAPSCDIYINPFVKIYDAASSSGKSVLLDVQEGGANYDSHTGDMAFYEEFSSYEDIMDGDNIQYNAPHWMAPVSEGDSTLVFNVPDVIKDFNNPVLELTHFAIDSDERIDFYLLDEDSTEIAHIYFELWEVKAGGVLKNQIPLGIFRNSAALKIKVVSGSSMGFPGFIRIFDADFREGHVLDADTAALWRLNESSMSANAADETGNYNLSQFGSPDVISGQIGNGRLLNGVSRFFQRAGDADLGTVLNGDWTYEGWVYLAPSFSTWGNLFIYNGLNFSWAAADTILAEVGVAPARKIYWHQWRTNVEYTETLSSAALQTGQFYHIAVSRTAQGGNLYTYRIYINGAIDTVTSDVPGLSYAVSGASHFIGLGCYTGDSGLGTPGNILNGRIDDTRISKAARSDEEVLQSYQRGL